MNYSYVPQKFTEKMPIYSNICPICRSNNSFPLINMIGSTRICNICKNIFKPKISGYKEVVVER